MRLRRSVVGGLVVRNGVVPALLDRTRTGSSRSGNGHGPLPLRRHHARSTRGNAGNAGNAG
ncbi:hypothetical protein, partial [Streptomyces sp. NRRL S-146]|uniref:hypothetical protein n=1 Tax=Streptomyces sp. NRRL S-146 TaxID=1463884 RepID=UPI003B63446A